MSSWHVIFLKKTWRGGFFKHCVFLGHPKEHQTGANKSGKISNKSENSEFNAKWAIFSFRQNEKNIIFSAYSHHRKGKIKVLPPVSRWQEKNDLIVNTYLVWISLDLSNESKICLNAFYYSTRPTTCSSQASQLIEQLVNICDRSERIFFLGHSCMTCLL